MRLQPAHAQRHRVAAKLFSHLRVRQQVQAAALIAAPGACRLQALGRVGTEHPLGIGAEQIAPLLGRDRRHQLGVRLREKPAHAIEEPVQLGRRAQEDAAQDKAGAALRMRLAVGQCQRRTPGAAKHQPALNAHQLTQALDVGHQVRRGVVAGLAQRGRLPGAALVKQHDAVVGWVKKLPMRLGQTGPRAAVQKQHRHPLRVAALLPVQGVQGVDRQVAAAVGLDRRIEGAGAGGVGGWGG